jgi:hypothetical protein
MLSYAIDEQPLAGPSNLQDTAKTNKKQKFLDSIAIDDKGKETSPGIAPVLNRIKENFPNISEETLKKLSTPEGLKNRKEIIENLSEAELIPTKSKDNIPLSKLLNEKTSILSNLSNIERERGIMRIDTLIDVINEEPELDKNLTESLLEDSVDLKLKELINENPGRSKQELTELLVRENPKHIDKILSIVNKTMNEQYSY